MNLFVNTETKQDRNKTKKNKKCRPDTKKGNASTDRRPDKRRDQTEYLFNIPVKGFWLRYRQVM